MNERINLVCLVAISVICALALCGWILLEVLEKPIPPGLYVIIGTALGSLTTYLQRATLSVSEFKPGTESRP